MQRGTLIMHLAIFPQKYTFFVTYSNFAEFIAGQSEEGAIDGGEVGVESGVA